MARKVLFKASFLKTFDALTQDEKSSAVKAVEAIQAQPSHGFAAPGLGIKKLRTKGKSCLFEARANLDLRILWVLDDEDIVFVQVGNHDDVKRFIKNL